MTESRSAGGTASTTEEEVVDDVEPAAFPTSSEEGNTAMKNIVEAMASVFFIDDDYFRKRIEKYELVLQRTSLER